MLSFKKMKFFAVILIFASFTQLEAREFYLEFKGQKVEVSKQGFNLARTFLDLYEEFGDELEKDEPYILKIDPFFYGKNGKLIVKSARDIKFDDIKRFTKILNGEMEESEIKKISKKQLFNLIFLADFFSATKREDLNFNPTWDVLNELFGKMIEKKFFATDSDFFAFSDKKGIFIDFFDRFPGWASKKLKSDNRLVKLFPYSRLNKSFINDLRKKDGGMKVWILGDYKLLNNASLLDKYDKLSDGKSYNYSHKSHVLSIFHYKNRTRVDDQTIDINKVKVSNLLERDASIFRVQVIPLSDQEILFINSYSDETVLMLLYKADKTGLYSLRNKQKLEVLYFDSFVITPVQSKKLLLFDSEGYSNDHDFILERDKKGNYEKTKRLEHSPLFENDQNKWFPGGIEYEEIKRSYEKNETITIFKIHRKNLFNKYLFLTRSGPGMRYYVLLDGSIAKVSKDGFEVRKNIIPYEDLTLEQAVFVEWIWRASAKRKMVSSDLPTRVKEIEVKLKSIEEKILSSDFLSRIFFSLPANVLQIVQDIGWLKFKDEDWKKLKDYSRYLFIKEIYSNVKKGDRRPLSLAKRMLPTLETKLGKKDSLELVNKIKQKVEGVVSEKVKRLKREK